MTTDSGEITRLLHAWRGGDSHAESQLFERLLPDLRRIAGRCFRSERADHTLQATALVHEAYLRLASARHIDWRDRGHFLALAARVMRHYLIDHARAQPSVQFVALDGLPEHLLARHTPLELMIGIDKLLDELEAESHTRRVVVELKFFLGMTDDEAAAALEMTLHTFQREWYRARRWLFERLGADAGSWTQRTINA